MQAYSLAHAQGYLVSRGWFKSKDIGGEPVDFSGNSIPWITYSAIDFLTPRINREMKVFEYGSGGSTLWWAGKVKSVVSIEYDKNWYEKIKSKTERKSNVKLIYSTYDKNACGGGILKR